LFITIKLIDVHLSVEFDRNDPYVLYVIAYLQYNKINNNSI